MTSATDPADPCLLKQAVPLVQVASFGLVANDDVSGSQPCQGGSGRRFGAHIARGASPWTSHPPTLPKPCKGGTLRVVLTDTPSRICRPSRAWNASTKTAWN